MQCGAAAEILRRKESKTLRPGDRLGSSMYSLCARHCAAAAVAAVAPNEWGDYHAGACRMVRTIASPQWRRMSGRSRPVLQRGDSQGAACRCCSDGRRPTRRADRCLQRIRGGDPQAGAGVGAGENLKVIEKSVTNEDCLLY